MCFVTVFQGFEPGLPILDETLAYRLFRENLGGSFEDCRVYHRIQMAKRLLKATNDLVKIKAWKCEFKNQHRLTETSKKLVRVSPSQCRKICADKRTGSALPLGRDDRIISQSQVQAHRGPYGPELHA